MRRLTGPTDPREEDHAHPRPRTSKPQPPSTPSPDGHGGCRRGARLRARLRIRHPRVRSAEHPRHAVRIASGSKAFTALAVMRLVEDGTLHLDQPVRELLGADLPEIDDAVTIEHLLTHTSGIGDYLDEEAEWEPSDYVLAAPVHTLDDGRGVPPARRRVSRRLRARRALAYCNGGYIVLAIILERVTGESTTTSCGDSSSRRRPRDTDFLRLDDCRARRRSATSSTRATGSTRCTCLCWATATGAPLRRQPTCIGSGVRSSPARSSRPIWSPRWSGRADVPDEGLRCGMGFFLHATAPAALIEGYDAGVSFRSTHIPASATTAWVFGNSSEGAWPVVRVVADASTGARSGGGDDRSPEAS